MSARFLCFCIAAGAPVATLDAQRVLAEHFGTQANARHGASLAAIADYDGDRVKDLVIGEPHQDYNLAAGVIDSGAVVLRSSRTGTLRARQQSTEAFGNFGSTVAALGDVNGDGVADFAGGGPLIQGGSGRARIFSGADGVQLWFTDGEDRSLVGTGIADAGDMNGDGRADVAISAPRNSTSSPYSFVRYHVGATGARVHQLVSTLQTEWGRSLASIPDVTGDGQPDLIVGEPYFDFIGQSSGRVSLVDPRLPVPSSIRWQAYAPFLDLENAGLVVAAAGDLDGDGLSEVLVAGNLRRVYVLSGANGALLFSVGLGVPDFGASLAACGDFDGDGRNDFAVGAPGVDTNAGHVYIFSNRGVQIAELLGQPGSRFGSALAGIGDLDGDGLKDLAVGAPLHSVNGAFLGRVSIHGFRVYARATLFGTRCSAGSSNPNLYPNGAPALGSPFAVRCSQIPQSSLGFWLIGLSATQSAFGPLPFDLTTLGFSGCSFLVSHDVVIAYQTANASVVELNLSVPNSAAFLAASFYVQAGFLDPSLTRGLSLSRGLDLGVGHP